MTMFNEWLMTTRVLQRQSFGVDPATLDNKEVASYIRWNHTALIKELSEALDWVDWKPWTVTENGVVDRDAYLGELVDVGHFLANLLVAAGCTDEEFSALYTAKQQKNRERMASGTYTGIKATCQFCGRVYDDAATRCTPGKSLQNGAASPYCPYTHMTNASPTTCFTCGRAYDDAATRCQPDPLHPGHSLCFS